MKQIKPKKKITFALTDEQIEKIISVCRFDTSGRYQISTDLVFEYLALFEVYLDTKLLSAISQYSEVLKKSADSAVLDLKK